MSSKTTVSIWRRTWRSSSRHVRHPASTSSALLRRARALQVAFRDLSRAHQHCAERMRVRADGCGDDAPALEADDAFVIAQRRRDAQRPRLPTQIEELEDVVDAELAERTFDRH
jgi:hypothetical protein